MLRVCRGGGVYLFSQNYHEGTPGRTLGKSEKFRKTVKEIPQTEPPVIHSTKTYIAGIPDCFMALRQLLIKFQLSLSLSVCLILETLISILFP